MNEHSLIYMTNLYNEAMDLNTKLLEELENLKGINEEHRHLNGKLREEIERLHSIIKEVREYIMTELITEWDIENGGHVSGSDLPVEAITPILDILEKEKQCTNCGQEKEQ